MDRTGSSLSGPSTINPQPSTNGGHIRGSERTAARGHGYFPVHRHRRLHSPPQHLGERYSQVLADQRRLLRAAFQARSGHELGTEGDSFFVAFSRATDALAAVVVAQRALTAHSWPDAAPARVRMGLHTGEPTLTSEGYVGLDVHRA